MRGIDVLLVYVDSSDQDTFLLTASLLGDGAPALVSGVERFNYTVSTSLPYFIRVKTAIVSPSN